MKLCNVKRDVVVFVVDPSFVRGSGVVMSESDTLRTHTCTRAMKEYHAQAGEKRQ